MTVLSTCLSMLAGLMPQQSAASVEPDCLGQYGSGDDISIADVAGPYRCYWETFLGSPIFTTLSGYIHPIPTPGDPGSPDLTADGDGLIVTYESFGFGGPTVATHLSINGIPVLRDGDPVLAAGVPPGSTYGLFGYARMNALDQVLLVSEVVIPGVGTRNTVLLLDIDFATGAVSSGQRVLGEGDPVPGLPGEFVGSWISASLHDCGEALILYQRPGLFPWEFVQLRTDFQTTSLVAYHGGPSPIAGRKYVWFGGRDLDSSGRFAMHARLDGDAATDDVLIVDDQVFVQEGDMLATVPAPIEFGVSPVTNAGPSFGAGGRLAWRGQWQDPGTGQTEQAFFVDRSPVFVASEFGFSPTYGVLSKEDPVIHFSSADPGFPATSRIFTFDVRSAATFCTAKASSSGCVAQISADSCGPALSGANDYRVKVETVQGQRNGLIFVGLAGSSVQPFLGGTLCVQPPLGRTPVQNSGGVDAVSCTGSYDLLLNDGVSSWDVGSGNTLWLQAWYRDPLLMDGFDVALSNALRVEFE